MKLIALKIDVDNTQAMQIGLPAIADMLRARQAGATFFWSLGLEKNGRFLLPAYGLRRMPGMSNLPLKRRFGLSPLLLGSVVPAKNLAKQAATALAQFSDAQFEHAVRPTCRYLWQARIREQSAEETREQYQQALQALERLTGQKPIAHAAHGWQMNRTAFRLSQLNQLSFASDCRGFSPFWPVVEGEYIRCLQIPVTLPMLEELLPVQSADAAVQSLLQTTAAATTDLHVFNIAADFDVQYSEQLAALLDGWIAQGYQLVSLGGLKSSLDLQTVPYHHVGQAQVSGRVGLLSVQAGAYP
jgi:undecaprenyl phosphate-alpha-L-ara4FN deformylase